MIWTDNSKDQFGFSDFHKEKQRETRQHTKYMIIMMPRVSYEAESVWQNHWNQRPIAARQNPYAHPHHWNQSCLIKSK
jgi:hypothetical protein